MMNNEGPFVIPGEIIPCVEISDQRVFERMPLVSVHMITYNHGPYIAQAIEGVLQQETDFPIELIIGEDCSADCTREIALEYQKKYPDIIRVLTSEKNVGMNKNARRVLATCRGKYIAFCEGDDYWHHPGKLQMQIDFLNAHAECVLVYSDFDHRVGNRVLRSYMKNERWPVHVGKAYESLLRLGHQPCTMTRVCRRSVLAAFEDTSFARKDYKFGDYSHAVFASLHGDFGYIDESLAVYRHVQGSAMNSGYQSNLQMALSILQCQRDFIVYTSIRPENWLARECQEFRNIYHLAYLARDMERFEEATHWLMEYDMEFRKGWKHHIRRLIMRSSLLTRFVHLRYKRAWLRTIAEKYEPLEI
jgi:glycosyltransferase involved in cell wall biosynthesis